MAPTPLSSEAQQLLLAATTGPQHLIGRITVSRDHLAGPGVAAVGRSFGDPENSPENARWLAAIDELVSNGLARDASGTGKVYGLTDAGYRAAEAFAR